MDNPKLARQAFAVGADTLTTNRAKFINDVLLSSGDETKSIRVLNSPRMADHCLVRRTLDWDNGHLAR